MSSTGKKILLVDDDENSLRGLAEILREDGFVVEEYSSPLDALAAVRERSFDIMLTDLLMPHMTGVDLLDEAKKIRPEMSVVLITAYGETESYLDAMNKGAVEYLNKPIDYEELTRVLARL